MPAPGEQHLNVGGKAITNPFEEVKPRISEYTASEIATLSSKLEKQLGPEYISSRQGPGGGKVHYLAAEKCIQLANEVFGFNGWSSQIMDVQVDFVDEDPKTLRVSLGLSVTVRVTLRDGTFHEDIGYGHMENSKGKAAAFEKAKKEGTTDGLKRALRNFGNVLGNCIYDKDYLKQVTKVKAQPTRLPGDRFEDRLHRHSDFVKREIIKVEVEKREVTEGIVNGASLMFDDTLIGDDDDEYGDFDDADLNVADPDSHPDEVVLPAPSVSSRHFNNSRISNVTNGPPPNQNRPPVNQQRPLSVSNQPNGVPPSNNVPQQPQTPNGGLPRSSSGAGPGMRPQPQQPPMQPPQLKPIAGRVLNQPSRNNPPGPSSGPTSPMKQNKPSSNPNQDPDLALPPAAGGFFSARGVVNLPEPQPNTSEPPQGPPPPIPGNLPAFNPHAESPSIRKTPGIDHKISKPLTRDLKHVPGGSQAVATGGGIGTGRGNVINPQLDQTRRIGAPGSPSPSFSRGGVSSYKPPTMKRPVDGGGAGVVRPPLHDLGANGAIGAEGGDLKRQKVGP